MILDLGLMPTKAGLVLFLVHRLAVDETPETPAAGVFALERILDHDLHGGRSAGDRDRVLFRGLRGSRAGLLSRGSRWSRQSMKR